MFDPFLGATGSSKSQNEGPSSLRRFPSDYEPLPASGLVDFPPTGRLSSVSQQQTLDWDRPIALLTCQLGASPTDQPSDPGQVARAAKAQSPRQASASPWRCSCEGANAQRAQARVCGWTDGPPDPSEVHRFGFQAKHAASKLGSESFQARQLASLEFDVR